jgi:hypothetical protein
MEQPIYSKHVNDAEGNPAGGVTHARGLCIVWQDGPLGRGPEQKEPNGAFVETVIRAVMDRLAYYQGSKFACRENAEAHRDLDRALQVLRSRTSLREARGVEGTCEV